MVSEPFDPNQNASPDEQLDLEERADLANEYYQLAMYGLEQGRNLPAALVHAESALEYQPDSAAAHNLRGRILEDMGRLDEAHEAYQKAVELDPDFKAAADNLADLRTDRLGVKAGRAAEYLDEAQRLYDEAGDYENALAVVDKAILADPEKPEPHNLRGVILDAMGKLSEAAMEYELALRLDPGALDARENLESLLKEAPAEVLQPTNEPDMKLLAHSHLEQARAILEGGSDSEAALAACILAIQYDPDNAEAYNLRGLILDDLDRPAEAIEAYQKAVDLKPDFEEATANLQEALADYRYTEREEEE